MPTRYRVNLLIVVCLMLGTAEFGMAAHKPALAVMPFQTNGVAPEVSRAMTRELQIQLESLKKFRVMGGDELQATGCDASDQECLLATGARLGVELLVAGSLSKIGGYYFVSLRLLNVQGQDAGLRHRVSERCDGDSRLLARTVSELADRLLAEAQIEPLRVLEPSTPLPKEPPVLLQADQPVAGDVWTEPLTAMEFVWVPGGCTLLGSPGGEEGRFSNEGPQQKACVAGFWIGRHEVTNGQYRQFRGGHSSRSYESTSLNTDSQPVVYVSWEDAVAYAEWLSNQAQIRFRLPTEAQWDYAARAGTTSPFFWGSDSREACTYANVADQAAKRRWPDWTVLSCEDGVTVSAPVGQYAPNPFGLYDMLGNVWEWCRDRYRETPGMPKGASATARISDKRVYRGGSWNVQHQHLRVARRISGIPTMRSYNVGFRLVREN